MGIFARELKAILEAHQGDDLGVWQGAGPKTDPVWYPLRRLAVYSQQIKRLKHAAESESAAATLHPDDLERLTEALHFKPDEQKRLRAALLAQGVEMFLTDRMLPTERDVIAEATEAVFQALQNAPVLDRIRGLDPSSEAASTDSYVAAMRMCDRAGTAEWMAFYAEAVGQRAEASAWGARALAYYERAERGLEPASDVEELADIRSAMGALKSKHQL